MRRAGSATVKRWDVRSGGRGGGGMAVQGCAAARRALGKKVKLG